jgi:hypothetical protein
MTRKSLSDILRNGDRENLSRAWDETEAAEEFSPLPSGDFVCRLIAADPFNAKTRGTPGVKLVFRVIEGEHKGRQIWHDCWLTPAALAQTKRDLVKLGVSSLEQLERPLPPGIRCRVKVVLRKDDDGAEFNRVRRFEVIGIDEPERDAFAPQDAPGLTPQAAEQSAGGEHDRF